MTEKTREQIRDEARAELAKKNGSEAWITAICIFGRHTEYGAIPMQPEHDEIFVHINPKNVTEAEMKLLLELDWMVHDEFECFHRFVSC